MKSKQIVRIFSIVMSFFIVIGVIALNKESVLAASDATTGLTYTISDGKAKVTDFTAPAGFSGTLVIPTTLGGASVTSIGDLVFSGRSSLTSVSVPSTVTSIGTYAFLFCENLTFITIDAENTAYKSLDGILYSKDGKVLICCPGAKTGSVTIPGDVTRILAGAFAYCFDLTDVTIPYSVTSIEDHAFYGCTSLTGITIPVSVTNIGEAAFQHCESLSAAYFYGNAPTMGDYVFDGCTADLTVYYLSSKTGFTNPWYGYPAATFIRAEVSYQTHVQDIGWQDYVSNGAVSGTSAQSKRLEAIRIKVDFDGTTGGIEYRTHVQDIGWQGWVANDVLSGTSGQSKRLEAIQIRLTGEAATLYDVYYRVHAQNVGWMDWAKNGESSGTAGFSYRLEAIEVKLVLKGGAAPGETTWRFIDKYEPVNAINYKTHVQDVGWQPYVSNGAVSGTSGESKRLEAIQIKLQDIAGGIEYRTHVQDIGWMDWVSNDALSGTSAQSKRLETIQIRLTGEAADKYDLYYCVHAENTGWLDWAKNGQSAGTSGFGYRLEAIQIVLVAKGGPAPGMTERAFVQG